MTTPDRRKIVGQAIKDARSKKNLTQLEVSQKGSISRNYVSDIENGRYMPSVETLMTLATILDIDLNLLPKMTEIQV